MIQGGLRAGATCNGALVLRPPDMPRAHPLMTRA